MTQLRVAAIAGLTPLEKLDEEPFLVDSRAQHAQCASWAEKRGYVITAELLTHALPFDHRSLWKDADAGRVDLFVAPSRRVLDRALDSPDAFAAECARRGLRLETTGLDEPEYDATAKARLHRRLSMPTAGYDGT
ncbi:hypothetical protein DSC45_26345 [Streptomyces sp. YIM 130001]|uniref:hypothetical protein n=1 Tax=Streptomyces sp. YIM 130001 TaxID=2259644 RepID=UPI000E656995|nr:hypothetical protein [Streptomyces sp. YIM 130001]RII12388.1 hypothetical protein DSC45_26345 [Streptomyces sp. YIM 130001]